MKFYVIDVEVLCLRSCFREIFAVTIYLNRWKAGYHLNLPYTDFSFPSLPDCDENVVIVRTCRYYEGPYAVVTTTPRKLS